MGRGLSQLQLMIVAEARGKAFLPVQDIYEKLCRKPWSIAMDHFTGLPDKERGEAFHVFELAMRHRRRRRADWMDYWRMLKSNMSAEVREAMEGVEKAEAMRVAVEAAVSRAITRLVARGVLERCKAMRGRRPISAVQLRGEYMDIGGRKVLVVNDEWANG